MKSAEPATMQDRFDILLVDCIGSPRLPFLKTVIHSQYPDLKRNSAILLFLFDLLYILRTEDEASSTKRFSITSDRSSYGKNDTKQTSCLRIMTSFYSFSFLSSKDLYIRSLLSRLSYWSKASTDGRVIVRLVSLKA